VTIRPDVELRLPAESAYVSVLRMTTAGLAARVDFTIDDIEDLRMAVGEASAILLERAASDGNLHCSFELGEKQMRISVAADTVDPTAPDQDSWAWQVLAALTTGLEAEASADRVTITLSMSSGASD
jgi:serine/threonine-protein kinase RsbW